MKSLVVLLGAGASYDCLQSNADGVMEVQPPLAKQLFDYQRFAHILDQYPRAQMAAADIVHALGNGTVGLEEYLVELRDSTDEYSQQRWREVPLYLQHLLFHIGLPRVGNTVNGGFTNRPANYDRLLNATLKLDDITFVTLNYDTILDDRLRRYESSIGTESMKWYVRRDRNWALIKLHGSVNWGRRVLNDSPPEPQRDTGVNVVWELGDAIEVSPEIEHLSRSSDIAGLRWAAQNGHLYYPALSVPLGPEDTLSCPVSHLDFLRERLGKLDVLNLLVIGYSGLDTAVLDLLRESGKELGQLKIVNGEPKLGYDAATNLMAGLDQQFDPAPVTSGGGFRDFVAGHDLTDFLAGL